MHGYIDHPVTLRNMWSIKIIQQDELTYFNLDVPLLFGSIQKIPRHTRIPTAMATIDPKTPAIMSQSELRILLSIHSSI